MSVLFLVRIMLITMKVLNLSETNSLIRHKTNLFESKMSRMKKINGNV